ncbi:hypothetical protein M0812_30201 [Anaeramoeba flamelloides]|uniref:Stealth protein CR2 conserved region 2 domain-containing protein n=1 Tax=Anaeramoeba flamelloides TaxID=1746091 RepID=A0AAV7Y563_9EUKA|nr:hypothetical protein M0812_30201 [Anaeramoeba flamelloides]
MKVKQATFILILILLSLFILIYLSNSPQKNKLIRKNEIRCGGTAMEKEFIQKTKEELVFERKEIDSERKELDKRRKMIAMEAKQVRRERRELDRIEKQKEQKQKREEEQRQNKKDEQTTMIFEVKEIEKMKEKIQKREKMITRYRIDIDKLRAAVAKKETENKMRDSHNLTGTEKEQYQKTQQEIEENEKAILQKTKEQDNLKKVVKREKKVYQMKKEISEQEDKDKIDIVYTWGGVMNDMNKRNRYNYELQFSLRSVHKYVPWINKIYILINTNTDYPYWLKQPQEIGDQIVVVDRCQFFENPNHCPSYNSFAVYSVAHLIPGLSNKFLLMDDDFFFNQPITKDYLFAKNGLPKVYDIHKRMVTYSKSDHSINVARERDFPLYKYRIFSHMPKPMRRDLIIRFHERYPGYAEFVQSHKTRYKQLTEDLSMIYYEFMFDRDWIVDEPVERSCFYQLPKQQTNSIAKQFDDNYIILTTRKIIFFNCNDNLSKNIVTYKNQLKVLWKFYNRLYPEVPNFESPNIDHKE